MDLKQNKRAAVVGVFIFLAVIIFIAGVFMVGGGGSLLSKKAEVKAVFDDIKGLKTGNNIWYSGVKVGTIKKTAFNPDGSVLVTMGIDEDAKKFIPRNVQAKVSTDGLVGNKIIMLTGGTPGSGSIQGGETLGIAKDVDTEEMMVTLQKNNENLVAITENMKTLTGQIASGKGTAGKLLFDESLYSSLQSTLAAANRTAANAGQVTSQLASFTAKLNDKGTITHELVSDTVLFSSLKRSAMQMEKASASITTMSQNFATASEGIRSGESPAGVLLTDKQAAEDLKEILENLNQSSKKMDQTLEAAQHSIFLRGFFKKKAKQEAAEAKNQ